jgi:hypothetical protein
MEFLKGVGQPFGFIMKTLGINNNSFSINDLEKNRIEEIKEESQFILN